MTAETLLRRLVDAGCEPAIEGDELVLNGKDAPRELEILTDILQTSIRAIITGAKLYAVNENGKGCIRPDGLIDPRHLLPPNVRLVCVAGGEWDRISPFAAESLPQLFEPKAEPKKSRKGATDADQSQVPY